MHRLDLPRRVLASTWTDAALALALLALGQYEVWGGVRYEGAPVFPGSELTNALVVVPLLALPLILRRRRPLLSAALVLGGIVVSSLALGGAEATTQIVSAVISVYSATANSRRRLVVLAMGVVAILAHELRDPHVHGPGDAVYGVAFVVVAWLLGVAVHGRQREIHSLEDETVRLSAERELHAREAVDRERARVARELHDVVAHAVSVVVVQAQAGQRLVGRDDERATASFVAIEETARTALVEMRRLLGMLRDGDAPSRAPQPGLTSLDELVAGVRDAGLAVSVEITGAPSAISPGIDLSAYRVVQEGLTNALRHSAAGQARVEIRYRTGSLELQVLDAGPGAVRRDDRGDGGRGLAGMRERVALYGGTLECGPDGGGWRLRALLPLEEPA